jgi:hypothetical protein
MDIILNEITVVYIIEVYKLSVFPGGLDHKADGPGISPPPFSIKHPPGPTIVNCLISMGTLTGHWGEAAGGEAVGGDCGDVGDLGGWLTHDYAG